MDQKKSKNDTLGPIPSVTLSPHFTLGELTKTSVKGVNNVPPQEAIENLKRVCEWLEHLRAQYNLLYSDGSHPIIINSGYRSEAVNKKVGGSPTSNHLTGCAVDIKVFGIEEALRYAVILLNYADLTREKEWRMPLSMARSFCHFWSSKQRTMNRRLATSSDQWRRW